MCKISDKIKFCTCVDEDVEIEKLDNYWILYREDKSKKLDFIIQIGEFVLTENMSSNFEFNKNTILKRLNEDDAFDMPIQFKKNDYLQVNLISKNDLEKILYSFWFYYGTWKFDDSNYIGQYNDQINQGTLDNLWDKK